MTTKTLLNHYFFEVENKTVDIYRYGVNADSDIFVITTEGNYHFIPLLDYITFVFNKSIGDF